VIDWRAIVAALQHGVVVLDEQSRIVASNPAAERLLGRDADTLQGRRADELELALVGEDGADLDPAALPSLTALRTGTVQRDVLLGIEREGGLTWLEVTATPLDAGDGRARVVITFVDVSARRESELEWRRLSHRDDLTGLPNRRRFAELLDRHLSSQRLEDAGGALLLIDLDRFKELNDTFGHAAGDRLLVHVARAIEDRVRAGDAVARLGGDEFAVLLKRVGEGEAAYVAQALVDRLARELMPAAHGGTRPVTASIGVMALAGAVTGTAERALARADAALYEAKAAGRGGWRVDASTRPGGAVALGTQLAKRDRQLALANALGGRLAGISDLRAIADITVEELRRAFGYHLCAIIRLRDDDQVEALAVRGAHFDALALRGWSQPREHGLIGRCLRDRTPVMVNDVLADPDYHHTPETSDVRSELVVPLIVEAGVWGAINVEELEPGAFDHDDVTLLSTLANQVAAAVRAAALLERVTAAEAALAAGRGGSPAPPP
jgi:diguanylate cyclase (GGDEF)-like protein/PAS domain S-box-containing protein